MLVLFSGMGMALKIQSNPWIPKAADYQVRISCSKFEGVFKGLKTSIQFDEINPEKASIEASIDAQTINTGNGLRNKHAKQGLEAAKYPTIKVVSSAISGKGNSFQFKGKLTIKDVTRDLNFPFQFNRKSAQEGLFTGSFTVKPSEFNIHKSGTPESFIVSLQIPVTQ